MLKNVKHVSCGAYSSACIADPGLLYTWGAGHCLGRLRSSGSNGVKGTSGIGKGSALYEEDACQPEIPAFFLKRRVQGVLSGENYVIVKSGPDLWAWGKNSLGQLGKL